MQYHTDLLDYLAKLYYTSNYIILHEEYLIFDLNSIVVAVGGSLGLFLGFSFLQCGNFILKTFKRFSKIVLFRL